MLDSPVSKIRFDLLTRFLVIGVVLNTTVGDLCHWISPEVVGFLGPFLQSAVASSKHASVLSFITSISESLSSLVMSLLRLTPLIKSSASAHTRAVANNGANGIIG
tara:strand:+ start:386 stop:703 length:318 start_codon:yes stop_codon:yes gene_type:complete